MRDLIQKKITKLILLLSVFCGLIMLGQPMVPSYAYDTTSLESSGSLVERLASLDGVTSVKQMSKKHGYQQVYRLTFRQPISYSNRGIGTFEQNVDLYYSGDENVTIVNTDGYDIMGICSGTRLIGQYNHKNANYIEIEYRFFGSSVPEDLNEDSTYLWNYLNSENAAMDFHRIIQSMSSILTGKRIWTGGSKGGYATNYQCYFQEKHGYHDADVFMAWVAPLSFGTKDSRISYALYNTIGDDMYGAETAKEYRNLVLKIQLEFVRYREKLQQRYYDAAIEQGCKFRKSYFTSDPQTAAARLWDVSIEEFAILEWQYYLKWDQLKEILNMTNEEEKTEALYDLMVNTVGLDNEAYNNGYLGYFIQAATEMGNYRIDLSYLRAAVAKEQKTNPDFPDIALPKSLEVSCSAMYLTAEQQKMFHYSGKVRNALLNWAKHTKSNCIMIQGAVDPWNFVGLPVTDNEHVHRYLGKSNHGVTLYNLTKDEREEITDLLNNWMSADSETQAEKKTDSETQAEKKLTTRYICAMRQKLYFAK